jgi:glycosyltransferase involved in cell wall biosynthesis
LTDRYPPYLAGGYEVACHAVAERLRARGHSVCVLTSNFGIEGTRIESHVRRLLHRPQDTASLLQSGFWECKDYRSLTRTMRAFRPDVIYAWSTFQLFASLHLGLSEFGARVVFNIQDLWLPTQLSLGEELRQKWREPGGGFVKRLIKPAVRTALKLSHPWWLEPVGIEEINLKRVVFCSRFRQRQHVEKGLPLGDSTVIYNGIEPQVFARSGDALPRNGKLRVLFAGRLVPEKGAHTAIEAIASLVNSGQTGISLSIAGSPHHPWEYSSQLKDMVRSKRLDEHVHFLGGVANSEMSRVYHRHDVLVFPSICDEGLPVTLLEAMACGLAVVSTTTGGSAELVRDGVNGLSFAPGDVNGLVERLSRLLEDRAAIEDLGSSAREMVRENFDLEKICDQTERYLAE